MVTQHIFKNSFIGWGFFPLIFVLYAYHSCHRAVLAPLMQLRMERDGWMLQCSMSWVSWKWACPAHTQPHLGHSQEVGPLAAPEYSSAQQPKWAIYHFLSLLAALRHWHCPGLRHLAPGPVGTSSRSPVWPCPSWAALSGKAWLWPRARIKCLILVLRANLSGRFSLLDFLAIKNDFQPFFHWLVLLCLQSS